MGGFHGANLTIYAEYHAPEFRIEPTFRLIGLALLAVVMCVNFASCSSDDEEGNGVNGGNNQKKLVRMVEEISDGHKDITDFSYDNNGRLVSIKYTENGNYSDVTAVSWDGNTISTREGRHTATFTLSNNLVKEWIDRWDYQSGEPNEYDYSFSYNSSNLLTKLIETYEDGDYNTYTLEWQNGKVSKFTDYDGEVYKYTYYDNINYKGYAPVILDDRIWHIFENAPIFYAHPELVGCRNLGLPKTITNTDTEEIISMTYEFYEDGYVKTRIMIDDNYTTTYTYTWE